MKLIDILLRHKDSITERGEATNYFAMDADGRVFGYQAMPAPGIVSWSVPGIKNSTDGFGCLVQLDPIDVLEEWQDCIVTLKQYEATLEASKQHWNGEGLPPVGTVCEYIKQSLTVKEWTECTIDYVGSSFIVYRDCYGVELAAIKCDIEFRPIPSEEDKKRDAACDAMHKCWREVAGQEREDGSLIDIYSGIYDAIADGKVPGIRIE